MSQTKKIQIKTEYLTTQERVKCKRKEKPKAYITPNNVKRALMERIKAHQKKNEEKKNSPPPVFATDFKNTLNYLDSVVSKNKTIKQKRKRKRRKKGGAMVRAAELPIHTKITNRDDPPWGILKGGKKPLYSHYKKTLKKATSIILPPTNIAAPAQPIIQPLSLRQKKLESLKKKMKTPTRRIRKKRYTLGKKKRKVGILIKSRETRRKIKSEHANLKKKNLDDIKLYLKKRGLIRVGSGAPEKILRQIYETAVLSGDIYNKNNDILIHNYINEKKG